MEWPHSFNNPDHVSIVIHNYGGGSDWLRASRDTTIWKRLSDASVITVPPLRSKVMRMERRIQTQAYAKKFWGKYSHRIIKGGIGHNLPQEAPQAYAKAVVDVNGY